MKIKKTILITGASGLLGSNILTALYKDYEIHALVHTIPRSPINEVTYHLIDFTTNWTEHNLPDTVNTIIHLAQFSNFREFPEKAMEVFKVNTDSTARLLDYAQRSAVTRFIYASSGGVYGNSENAFNENAPITQYDQLGYYLGSKLCSEVLIQSYASKMQISVLRFFFMYGPEQNRCMLIPRLVDRIKEGLPISIQGKQGIHINPIHVEDAAKAVIQALKLTKSAIFNIAGPDILSLRQIGKIIGRQLKIDPLFETISGNPLDLIGEISLMKRLLCTPTIQLSNGIKDIL